MKKSKIILGCIISVMTFVLTLLIGLPSKVYASEVSDYIDENYSNLVFSNNLYSGSQDLQGEYWNNDFESLSNSVNALPSGSYSLSLDISCVSKLPNKNDENGCFSFIEIIDITNNEDLIVQSIVKNQNESGLSLNFQISFTINENNNYSVRIWGCGNHSVGSVWVVELDNIMLNKGAYALPYEPYITGSMIYEQAFNKGVEDATNNNGIWKYIRNVYVGTEEDNNYNLNELKRRGFLNGYEMNLYSMSLVANESYSVIYIDFEFTSAPLTELDFFFKGYNSYTMNIYDEDGEVVNIDVSSLTALNYEDILQKNSNFGNYIDTISIVASSPDALDIILNNSSYSEGFQNGYSGGFISGKNEGYSQGFNAGLQDEANNKANYDEGYEDGSLSGYNQGYNEGTSSNIETNGIKTLFNSILSYPVNMISNVFNFEFMGINIASLIMFIISIGIVIFVVKKFW